MVPISSRADLLNSLAETIADYRQDEIAPRTPKLIESWLQQFPEAVQDPLLEALDYMMRRTYVSRDRFRKFLKELAETDKLSPGTDPGIYWRRANLLCIQQRGGSQREILSMFDEVLQETHGFGLAQTGGSDSDFIYLDNCIGTGTHLRNDVCNWIKETAPKNIKLHIITPILFTESWWADREIQTTAAGSGKPIVLQKCYLYQLENRREHRSQSDVLWPTSELDNETVRQYFLYLTELGWPPILRRPGNPGASKIFDDDTQKILVEEAFLTRGCEIRSKQTNLPEKMRPLGYKNLHTLGFGSMFVTYRNCPNNCPLVFWVEQDDFPALFPRKTNAETF